MKFSGKLVVLFGTLILLASCVNAFPLSGGNGQFNVTVVGTFTVPSTGTGLPDELFLDVLYDYRGDNVIKNAKESGLQDAGVLKINLGDSDDKFYDGVYLDIIGLNGGEKGTGRASYRFDNVPSKIDIKRVRITPYQGTPFSIEWTGVPEVKDASLGMKFYAIERKQDIFYDLDSLSADIKITNNAQTEQKSYHDQFVLVDQIGFAYKGSSGDDVTLLPSESMRFHLLFSGVSKLSRPVYLTYLPSNLTMDISAWV